MFFRNRLFCLPKKFIATLSFSLAAIILLSCNADAASLPTASAQSAISAFNVFISVMSAFFCASLFWWKRDKTKEQAQPSPRQVNGKPKGSSDNRQSSAPTVTANPNEVDSEVASWIKSNLEKKQTQQTPRPGSTANGAAPAQTTVNGVAPGHALKIPDSPQPVVPLPAATNEYLIEASEQAQNFTASEAQREAAVEILSSAQKSRESVSALAGVAQYDESSKLRIVAINALGECNHESVFEPILVSCTDPAREVRAAAARTLSRLSINRADALTRIIESGDAESLRLCSMACVDAGLAAHGFNRLTHADIKQAQEAFAIIRLLVTAGDFAPVLNILGNSEDAQVRLATIEALRVMRPLKILPMLYPISAQRDLPTKIKTALDGLIEELEAA